MTASPDDREIVLGGRFRAVVDGSQLRDAGTGDRPRRAVGTRADPDLDRVGPRTVEILDPGRGGNVSSDQFDVAERRSNPADAVQAALQVPVSDVDHDAVRAGLQERFGPGDAVLGDPDRSTDPLAVGGDRLDLRGLFGGRQESVDRPEAARPGERDRGFGLRDRVHRGRKQRQIQIDAGRQPGRQIDVAPAVDRRSVRHQQDVVVGQPRPEVVHTSVEVDDLRVKP